MSARELPGFYYDEERKKYFRIQPDHRAQGSAYSRSAVKAKKESRESEKAEQDRDTWERNGQIQRHDPNSYTSLSLALRLGQPRNILAKLAANYVSRLERSSSELSPSRQLVAFTVTPDGRVFTVITSPGMGDSLQINHSTADSAIHHTSRPVFHRHPWVSCISLEDPFLLIAYGGNIDCVPLHEPEDRRNRDYSWAYGGVTINDVAIPSAGSCSQIALATSDGLCFGRITHPDFLDPCPTLEKEQTVVSFQDPNIVMSGERSGAVNFTDIRVPSSVHRLQHSSAVNGIATGRSTNHVIVSGLGTVAIYDLRYSAPASRKRKHGGKPSSAPLVPFHIPRTHEMKHYTPGKNLLYSLNLDVAIVACQVSTDNTGGVLLYNASTGQILDSPIVKHRFHNMKGLAIARVRDGPESIFVGEGDELSEYSVDKVFENGPRKVSHDRFASRKTQGLQRNLFTERFPHDAELGVAELWRNGDKGPK